MASAGEPFVPVAKVAGGVGGPQLMRPAVDASGMPIWQAGDTNLQWWDIDLLGWCHGALANRRVNSDVSGRIYLTDSRIIAVVHDFAQGSKYRNVLFPSLTSLAVNSVANQVSQSRARRAEAGNYLVAHMRFPWVTNLVWARPDAGKRVVGTLRVGGQHRTAFGDKESVTMLLRLCGPYDPELVVSSALTRIRNDRLAWEKTDASERQKLLELPNPQMVTASPDSLPSISLAGAYLSQKSSAGYGGTSARSFANPPPPVGAAPSPALSNGFPASGPPLEQGSQSGPVSPTDTGTRWAGPVDGVLGGAGQGVPVASCYACEAARESGDHFCSECGTGFG
jgi:hypothetical protein